jgi:hypothetical protein
MTIGWILMKSEIGKAERIQGIQTFTATFRDTPLSKKAVKCLLNKYKGIFRVTSERSMTNARTDPINITNAQAYIDAWKAHQELTLFPLDHIINADETLLRACKDGAKVERLEASYKKGGSEVLDNSQTIGSLTPFVSAAGTVWLLIYCLKIPTTKSTDAEKKFEIFVPLEERQCRSTNSAHGILIFGDSTGLLNSMLWDRSVKKLIEIMKNSSLTPQKEIPLFTDNLGSTANVNQSRRPLNKVYINSTSLLTVPIGSSLLIISSLHFCS